MIYIKKTKDRLVERKLDVYHLISHNSAQMPPCDLLWTPSPSQLGFKHV